VVFSDIQIVHKFARRGTHTPDFKGTPLFDVEYLSNDTRYMVTTDH